MGSLLSRIASAENNLHFTASGLSQHDGIVYTCTGVNKNTHTGAESYVMTINLNLIVENVHMNRHNI